MYLWSRTATLQGPPAETMTWASDMTELVNRTVEDEVTLWQGVFGGPIGTLIWNTLIPSRARLATNMMAIMGSEEYHQRMAEGQQYLSAVPTEDMLRKFVFGKPGERPPDVGAAVESVTATPAPGHLMEAIEFGPHIAQIVERVTGLTPSFYVDAYGTFGQVTWFTVHSDFAAVDESQDKLMTSDEYMSAVERGGTLFNAGSGQRGLATRIA